MIVVSPMRFAIVAAVLVLMLNFPVGSSAEPAAADAPPACGARESTLGGIGRVTVFAFTGPVFGGRVCATVANFASDLVSARIADAPSDDALAAAGRVRGGRVRTRGDPRERSERRVVAAHRRRSGGHERHRAARPADH